MLSMCVAAVSGRLVPIEHAIVARHMGDTKPVVGEDAAPPVSLGRAMRIGVAPLQYRRFIPEEGKRQHLARVGEALESLDRDKTVDLD